MSTLVIIAIQVASHGPDSARASIVEAANASTYLDDITNPRMSREDREAAGLHRVSLLAQGEVSLGELGAWQCALIREAQAIERELVAHAETEVHVRPIRPAGSVSAFAEPERGGR